MNTTESDENRSNYLNWQGLIIKAFFIGNANSQDSNGSLQLNLEETQNDPPSVSLLQPSNFSSPPTSHQPHTKCVEKLKSKLVLDDSVIIEDTPEKENKSVSVIDISDSSPFPMGGSRDGVNLILDGSRDLNKSSGSVKEILSSSMSEILLGQNNLLYEECDNIDKVTPRIIPLNPTSDTFFLPGH